MAPRYRFDGFELDTSEQLLYHNGQPVGLGARAIAVLTALLTRPGRLVSKAELLEKAWPGLVVEENNLQVQVSALRKALGAHMIATVPARGYRFAQAVHTETPQAKVSAFHREASGPALSWRPPAAAEVAPALPSLFGGDSAERLLGRERELIALDALLPAALITVAGPAGVGKSALALAAAQRWQADRPDGSIWVTLPACPLVQEAPLCVLPRLVATLAQTLGIAMGQGDGLAELSQALRPVRGLIVLDNVGPHPAAVAAATELAQALVSQAPGIRLLLTCSAPLGLAAEQVLHLGPLALPAPDASWRKALGHGAIELLAEQLRHAGHGFELSADQAGEAVRLCRLLGGQPLAIKLVANCVPRLGWAQVLQRLEDQAPHWHQQPLAVLDWIHALLSPAEQTLLRRLAVFEGDVPLPLVPVVTQAGPADETLDDWRVLDTLASLVDRALVERQTEGSPRHRLHGSVRDFALGQLLASGEQTALRRHHALAVADLMDQAHETFWSTPDADWLRRHGADLDNVCQALDWAQAHDAGLAVRLMGASAPLFVLLGLIPQARVRSQALSAHAQRLGAQPHVARFWLESSRLHEGVDNAAMLVCAQRATEGARAERDPRGGYLGLRCQVSSGQMDAEQAMQALREMVRLERADWSPRLLAQRLLAEVRTLRAQERMADARRICQSLIVQTQAAHLAETLSAALSELGSICLALGDTDAAVRASQQILARTPGLHRRDAGALHTLGALAALACVALVRDEPMQARSALHDFVATSRRHGWAGLHRHAGLLALLAAAESRWQAAAMLLGHFERHSPPATHDVLGVYVRTRVRAALDAHMEPTVLRHWVEQGRQLDAPSACAWALDEG